MLSISPSNGVRLSDYFVLIKRRGWAVLLGLAIGIGLAFGYLSVAPESYSTDTFVLVNPTPADSPLPAGVKSTTPVNLDTEAQMVTSTGVFDAVAKALHLSADDAALLPNDVTVTVPPNTSILDITFVASTPAQAQKGSIAFATAYLAQRQAAATAYLQAQAKGVQAQIDAVNAQLAPLVANAATLSPTSADRARADQQINTLTTQLAGLTSQQHQLASTAVDPGRIVIQPAVPTDPSSPNKLIVLAAGAGLGLLLGVGLAVLRHRADDRIRTREDLLRRTDVPLATALSTKLSRTDITLLPSVEGDGRNIVRLRNLVSSALAESDRRVVLVAGVRRGGGPVAANLAASLARTGEQVFLVCGDVFASTATSLLHGPAKEGLAEVLAGNATVASAARAVPDVPGLRVLSPGRNPERADALLQTKGPRQLIDELLDTATYVVIEAPATANSTDAQTLAQVSDLAVLVVEAHQTRARDVSDAVAQFRSMHTPVLGAVFARYRRDHGRNHAELDALDIAETPASPTDRSVAAGRGRTGAPAARAADGSPADGDAELVRSEVRGRPRP